LIIPPTGRNDLYIFDDNDPATPLSRQLLEPPKQIDILPHKQALIKTVKSKKEITTIKLGTSLGHSRRSGKQTIHSQVSFFYDAGWPIIGVHSAADHCRI
jgi:hypothetical protein